MSGLILQIWVFKKNVSHFSKLMGCGKLKEHVVGFMISYNVLWWDL
jgi:hypothetical protein